VWRFEQPTSAIVADHLVEQRGSTFTYREVGATRDGACPPGYVRDHNRERLGVGEAAFAAARAALREWTMFPRPFARIVPAETPIREGEVVGVVIRALGLWWLNAARIVYVIDEPQRFGFAYGTLPGHAECGEERFLVEQLADGTVWYDLLAFSRPRYWAARVAAPLTRRLQWRFARLSRAAMRAAVEQREQRRPGGPISGSATE
jgi:uncharacterized protein (UPF0548 family)